MFLNTKFLPFFYSIISFCIFILFFFPFGKLGIYDFHSDDFNIISRFYTISNFSDLHKQIFDFSGLRFRPLANLHYFIEYRLFGTNYHSYILYNFLLLSISYFFIFKTLFHLEVDKKIIFFIAIIFSLSKFFIYHALSIAGSYEGLSIVCFSVILYSIFTKNFKLFLVFICILFFNSERFIFTLMFLPYVFSYFSKEKLFSIKNISISIILFLIYCLIRIYFEIPMFVGSNTHLFMYDLNITRFFLHFIKSLLEVFGFSLGPSYLTGIELYMCDSVFFEKGKYLSFNFLQVILLLLSFSIFVNYTLNFKNNYLFILLFFLILVSSSVTTRVELRWISPAYIIFLIIIFNNYIQMRHVILFRLQIYALLIFSLILNIYYSIHNLRYLYFLSRNVWGSSLIH